MSDELGQAYLDWCRFRLMNHYWPRVQLCIGALSQDDIWWREHETNNSVGNLLLHLKGNLNQFILAGVGGAPDTRDKPQEFAERQRTSKEDLMDALERALLETDRTLASFEPSRFLDRTKVQDQERTFLEVISIVVEHFALHVGQIVFITKLKTGKGLKL